MSWGLRAIIQDLEEEIRRLSESKAQLMDDLEADDHAIRALERENKRLKIALEEILDLYPEDAILEAHGIAAEALDKLAEP